jgi:hypothetical protein
MSHLKSLSIPFSSSFSFIKRVRTTPLSTKSRFFVTRPPLSRPFDQSLYLERANERLTILRDTLSRTDDGSNDLTPSEMSYVKHIWNKQLAWHELIMDSFVKRLLYVEPNLEYLACHSSFILEDEFFGYFDLCIRSLLPQTECIGRESYRSVHPSPHRRSLIIFKLLFFF